MKKAKFFCIILVVITVVPFYYGCKKGDGDPFLSLRSRDSRLINEWKLIKVQGTRIYTETVPKDSTHTTNYSFDGATYNKIITTTGTSGTTTSTYTGSYTMKINEDGTISTDEVITTPSLTSTTTTLNSKGTWVWVSGNKKKDHLLLSLGSSFTLFNGGLVYVSRLAGKEMVLKTSTSNSYSTGVFSYSVNYDYTYTFEKK